ncbi:hypothetical protein JCGZ_19133 [Jatropha curcas]|uniref:Uncharacterized protein n=1 Tax=Jatropha curcas TaxID=180498 RepID=A0A067K058_JATCU|nr:hypothetical protein JCGZ_19133 [Jatropha curcas]
MDRALARGFKALFCSFSYEDWDLLSPFELNGLSYYRNIRVQPELLRWLINHFDPLDNSFRHNDFEIYPLFSELSIISRRMLVPEEIPALPRLNIDPASLILHAFNFSAYEILSCDFGADVMPLRPFVDHALSVDRTSPQYLLLSGIDGCGSLRLVPIVKQMARRCMPLPFILAETFTWLGEHARDSSSVLGSMGSPLLLQDLTSEGVRWTCPLWYIERVTVSSFVLYVPLCGLTTAVAYYPSHVAKQYGRHQAVLDYTRVKGSLITQWFLSRFIST